MIDWLIGIDRELFILINAKWTSTFLDDMMPMIRNRNTWFPLYIIILSVGIYKLKWKFIPWLLCIILAVAFADGISSHIFKPFFGRMRPCNELSPVFDEMILRLKRCSGHNSFTSSHAANHMAIASFIFFACSSQYKKVLWIFFFWVLIICWAQIYVGVHYPLDILGGLMIGFLTALFSTKFYRFLLRKKILLYGIK